LGRRDLPRAVVVHGAGGGAVGPLPGRRDGGGDGGGDGTAGEALEMRKFMRKEGGTYPNA
jgi:hypothetical protein